MAEEISILEYAGTPVAKLARYSGTSTDYQSVVTWTVDTGYQGVLFEVAMVSSSYTKTQFKLVIGSSTEFTDKYTQTALSLPWQNNKLASATTVTLSAKSTDGTSITVDGSITGKLLP